MASKINFDYACNIETLFNDFSYAYTEDKRTLENFEHFLKISGLSTIHAEELFNYYLDPINNSLVLNKKSFKIRKTHPKRDAFIKKVLIPTAIFAAAIGAGVGAILGSGLIGGSTVLGIIPVSGTPGLTMLATSMVGALTGLIATPIAFKVKKAITKAHYKLWYKSAKRNLEEYKTGVDIESLHISSLMEKIENTKTNILKTKNGAWYTAPFRFMKRHYLNIINRNRIHHLEAYTKDLVYMFRTLENNKFEGQEEEIKPIYELLKQVDEFVAKDVFESKVYAMLTCKESEKHTHKSMIENVDIFASLKMYVDAMSNAQVKESKTTVAQAKKNSKIVANKKAKANEIINGERIIAKLVSNYESNLTTDDDSVDGGLVFEFDDSTIDEEVEVIEEPTINDESTEDVIVEDNVNNEDSAEEVVEGEFIIPETLPEEFTTPASETTGKLVAKTAQRLLYQTKPITYKGETIGTTLKIVSNGKTEKVNIRYMSSKNKIRVQTISEDGVVAERYENITDTIIPPYNQMNEILTQVAEDKHINNIDDLIIG